MDPVSAIGALVGLFGLLKGRGEQQNASPTGLDPAMQAQLMKMLGLQTQRAEETAPIHQAAMAMASHLAPKYARDAMTGPVSGGSGNPAGVTPLRTGVGSSPAMEAVMNWIAQGGGDALTLGRDGGPGSPDPFLFGSKSLGPKGPGIDPRSYEQPGPGWKAFFSPNPAGAFYGGGVIGGGGEQHWAGDRGRAY